MKLSQIRDALDSRKISVNELTSIYIDKIKKHNPQINSYITVCNDEALKNAAVAQKMIDENKSLPLTGIPLSVKDNICTKGIRTTCASKMLCDFIPDYDAHAIELLKSQGAVILGKTNMDEFATGNSSQNSFFGGVKNPHDVTRSPGGSSGGAAASVATGLCPVALGSDTGGSIRQPASLCGVTGLTPTYGSVSRYGLIAFASSLDRIGIIANSAYDTGYVLNAISGRDARDSTSISRATDDYTSLCGENIKGLKIGIAEEFFNCCDNEVCKSVLAAVEYYRKMGFEIVECSLPSLEYAVSAYYLISSAEASANLARYDGIRYGHRADCDGDYSELIRRSRTEGFGDEVKRRIMLGTYALSSGYYDEYYRKACMIRAQLKNEYNKIFEKCDVLITPTSPHTSPKLDELRSGSSCYSEDICTVGVNIAGLCAISTTCGYDKNSLPIGMSIVGKPFDEKTIIALCDYYEQDFDRREAVL